MTHVAVVIPCYKVTKHILGVIASIGPEIQRIIVVDDACPDGSGKLVQKECKDTRVQIVFHEKNQGVGGAVITGYKEALNAGAEIVVKLDGDGQMEPADIPALIHPLINKNADYSKGNRFYSSEDLVQMPKLRVFGNAALSLFSKVSSGYWNITDPTNGFTSIHSKVLSELNLSKIRHGYFFESDILYRLGLIRAVVKDVSLPARYGDEISNLRVGKVMLEFPFRHFGNFLKRIGYMYYIRDWSPASLELPSGLILFFFGLATGFVNLSKSAMSGIPSNAGTVMLSALPLIFGFQLILSFVHHDVNSVPKQARQLET